MRALRENIQHAFNPLHIFCRLRQCGVAAGMARKMSWAYERYVYRIMMP